MTDQSRRVDDLFDSILFAAAGDKKRPTCDLETALEAVDLIVGLLTAGHPTRHMMLMLSSFLEAHAQEFAKEQLGVPLKGRPRSTPDERIAGATFELALECGCAEDEALVMAYDSYHAACSKRTGKTARTYAGDRAKPAVRGKYHSERSAAENTMDGTIRPLLKKLGLPVSIKKPTGRPSLKSAPNVRKKVPPH